MIRWFANNGIAANLLMMLIILGGLHAAFFRIPLEVSPTRQYQMVAIRISYRGATAKDVEKRILIPIEKALEGLDGVEMLHSDGYRGAGRIYVEVKEGYNPRVVMEEVKSRIDTITTFPDEMERPRIYVPDSSRYAEVLKVAVTGDLSPQELRKLAQRVEEDLMEIDGISRVNLEGDRDVEISVEADLERLHAYNLGFRDLTNAIRRWSIDLPAGAINSTSGTLVVRTRGQAYTKADFEAIPVRAANGAEVLLGEVATVHDGFEEGEKLVRFNGEPALFVEVLRAPQENAIAISNRVQDYVKKAKSRFPDGVHLWIWDDESIRIRGRLSSLTGSMMQGGILVFIILGLFLRPQLAFWVVMGIPVAFAGGVLMMPWLGVTANMTSLFGFILVLGLVVDDAIVTGENVYARMKTGIDPLEAAVLGTKEVAVPVTYGVLTTVVAFLPLLYFKGWWGDFAKQIPPVVAAVLLFSLVESKLILPAHLKHLRVNGQRRNAFARFQQHFVDGLEWVVRRIYQPTLRIAVHHRATVIAFFIATGLLMWGYCKSGRMGFVSLPTVESPRISAYLELPDDTDLAITRKHINTISAAAEQLREEFIDHESGQSLVANILEVSGAYRASSHYDQSRGMVAVELMPPSLRGKESIKNSVIVKRWREIVGDIPGAVSLRIRSDEMSRRRREDYDEEALELELRGPASEQKNEIAQRIADVLREVEGITTAWAKVNYGQDELEFSLKPRAVELGLTQQALAEQVRQAFYGEEAQRILRDNDDIRVMVRLPRQARESLHTLDRLTIRTPAGAAVPLYTIADVTFVKAPSRIERNDRALVIRIGAMPEDETVDIVQIAQQVTPAIQALVNEGTDLSFLFRGYIAEHAESRQRTIIGFVALFFALYGLLAIPFKSIVQPIYVLISVPFGIVGALLGHIVMGITPSFLSVFGMLAVAGIVVNDALVLVDYVNRRCQEGVPLRVAVQEAGARRFRPIVLTSVTTFAGLVPILLDRSLQAQFLVPMAVTLGAGILVSTAITLYLIPCALLLGDDFGKAFASVRNWYLRPFRKATVETPVISESVISD